MGKDFTNSTSDRKVISKMNKEFKKLDTKIPNKPIKMGYMGKKRILNRGISHDQKALKEYLNLFSHQENENQNDSKILSCTNLNG